MESHITSFRKMIKSIKCEELTELCEQFLTDHEEAMKLLITMSIKYGLNINEVEAKECMMVMQANGEFDDVICFGIDLGSNSLYKRFHPS